MFDSPPDNKDGKKLNKKDYIYLGVSALGILVYLMVSKKKSPSTGSTSSGSTSSGSGTAGAQSALISAYQQGAQTQSQIDQQMSANASAGYGSPYSTGGGYAGSYGGGYSLGGGYGTATSQALTSSGGASPLGTSTTVSQSGSSGSTPYSSSGGSVPSTSSATSSYSPTYTAPVQQLPYAGAMQGSGYNASSNSSYVGIPNPTVLQQEAAQGKAIFYEPTPGNFQPVTSGLNLAPNTTQYYLN